MAKDMFYYNGAPNGGDGRCANCPFVLFDDGAICSETETNVSYYIGYDKINYKCPFIAERR